MANNDILLLRLGNVEATILPKKGGLLSSLKVDNSEILYTSSDLDNTKSGWSNSGCPLLFPFAGRCFLEGHPFKYRVNDTEYHMPIHGFAYAKPFGVLERSKSKAILELQSDNSTRALYPFDFKLRVSYELINLGIKISIDISNKSATEMPVAFGLHPFFKIPKEYYQRINLLLNTGAKECLHVTPAGAAGKSYPTNGPFMLERPEFNSLILGKLTNRQAVLETTNKDVLAKLNWELADRTKYIVLWAPTQENTEFYCIEPWMGLPDAISTGAGLESISLNEKMKQVYIISQ